MSFVEFYLIGALIACLLAIAMVLRANSDNSVTTIGVCTLLSWVTVVVVVFAALLVLGEEPKAGRRKKH